MHARAVSHWAYDTSNSGFYVYALSRNGCNVTQDEKRKETDLAGERVRTRARARVPACPDENVSAVMEV